MYLEQLIRYFRLLFRPQELRISQQTRYCFGKAQLPTFRPPPQLVLAVLQIFRGEIFGGPLRSDLVIAMQVMSGERIQQPWWVVHSSRTASVSGRVTFPSMRSSPESIAVKITYWKLPHVRLSGYPTWASAAKGLQSHCTARPHPSALVSKSSSYWVMWCYWAVLLEYKKEWQIESSYVLFLTSTNLHIYHVYVYIYIYCVNVFIHFSRIDLHPIYIYNIFIQ